jgi:putative transposase
MSERYKAGNEPAYYYMTCTVVGWLDVFSRDDYRQILIDSLQFCIANKGLHVNAFVFMTNHIHLIGWAEEGTVLSETMRDFKRHTGKEIIKAIETNPSESRKEWLMHMFKYFGSQAQNRTQHQFWQDGFHPVHVYSDGVIRQKLNYLHQNPVPAKHVTEQEMWYYSSAAQYSGSKHTPFEVEMWWPSQFITVR